MLLGNFKQAIPAAPPPPQPSQSATQAVPVSQAVPTEVVTSHSAAAPVTTSLPAQHVAQQQPVSFAAQAWNAVNTHFWGPQRAPRAIHLITLMPRKTEFIGIHQLRQLLPIKLPILITFIKEIEQAK